MAENSSPFMVKLRVRTDRLMAFGMRRHLPMRQVDTGYVLHCFLRELFGEESPQPFITIDAGGRWLESLGYGIVPAATLVERAKAHGSPDLQAACDLESLTSKRMPEHWRKGQRLGFQVRICPVIRKAKAGPHHRAGAEVDAFVSRCWQVDDRSEKISREQVYREWLSDQLDRQGSARLIKAWMERFSLARLIRRTHSSERKSKTVERPDSVFQGELEVVDDESFSDLLARGVGRHRAFGFGMVLLRPA